MAYCVAFLEGKPPENQNFEELKNMTVHTKEPCGKETLLKNRRTPEMSANSSNEPEIPRGLLSSLLCEERPITVDEACDIKLLLFGNTVDTFGSGWTKQGFKFRSQPSYGLLQKQSGPCGVIASVQAYVIYELLFGFSRTVLDHGFLRPDVPERREALARALAKILWQAGEQKAAIVAKQCDDVVFNESVTSDIIVNDGIMEYVKLKHFRSLESLLEHLYNFIQDAIKEGGCIMFLYSLILTHGIDNIKNEMDYLDNNLIGNDGYCSQEIVNLILTGRAVPNVFNGDMVLNSGGEETTVHKGISKRSKIGLLSLYEYQDTCTVGSHYKDPEYPIWVLLAESHFTVLFGTSRNIFKNPEKPFKLFYMDCLSKGKEEVSYIIKPTAKLVAPEKDNSLPVVTRCIHTRWPLADVESVEESQ